MLKKYSKSSAFYLKSKLNYFDQNDDLLKEEILRNDLYAQQPPRQVCKICSAQLGSGLDFKSHGIAYIFCNSCGHVNGAHEETDEFVDAIYIDNPLSEYSKDYLDEDYVSRTHKIYSPKVLFLKESLGNRSDITLLDIGCGSGYFVHACELEGIRATGIDVSRQMTEFGNTQISLALDKRPLKHVAAADFFNQVVQTDSVVVAAIGVLEHLKNPADLWIAFQNSGAEYLYYSVPMFSTSVALESVFQQVYPRQLSGGHTHLFTESSIEKMHRLFNLECVSQWRFGTDMMDLYRCLFVALSKNEVSEKFLLQLKNGLGLKIDELQTVLDKNDFCSEIHCLVKK
jgi:SAM-dependent methyltransferase